MRRNLKIALLTCATLYAGGTAIAVAGDLPVFDKDVLIAQAGGGHGGGHGGGQAGGGGEQGNKGQKGGQGGAGVKGKPWAGQELVDIGRLNVIRSPDAVLDRTLKNLLLEYDKTTLSPIYSQSVATFIATLDLDKLIDSPLANLSVLEAYWVDGKVALPGVTPASYIDFSAILIGTAVDKNMDVTTEMVLAVATIVGEDMTTSTAAAIAAKADDVREAILAIHG